MKHSNNNSYKKVWLVFLAFTMLLFISACSSNGDDQDNNNNDEIIENGDTNNNDNDNGNNDNDTITKGALIDNTSFSEPPNSTLIMEVSDGYLYSSTEEVSVVVDFYGDYEQLDLTFGSEEMKYYAYQTRLMEHMMTMPSDISSSDYEDRINEWEEKLTEILEEDGYLAALLIYGIEDDPDDAVTSEITDNLHEFPGNAKTAIYVPFAQIDY